MTFILGISAFFHDSAAVLLRDGQVVAAAQEERFSRVKGDASFPAGAIAFCLAEAGIRADKLTSVVFYERSSKKLARILETYLALAPRGLGTFLSAGHAWLGVDGKIRTIPLLHKLLARLDGSFSDTQNVKVCDHHLSHAASAFLASPFETAAVVTMDGVGEWATATVGIGEGNNIRTMWEQRFPHSVGLFYSAMTDLLGFRVNSGEYKLMGLAPYGKPKFAKVLLDNVIDVAEDGSIHLDQRYFDYCVGRRMTSPNLHQLLGMRPRTPESSIDTIHADLAASAQAIAELAIQRTALWALRETRQSHLCMAGGVAQNSVAMGKLAQGNPSTKIYVPSAPGDAGGALGAALWEYYGTYAVRTPQASALWTSRFGPQFDQHEIEERLGRLAAIFDVVAEADLPSVVASLLAEGAIVGWFQGRMEFGPRALGGRSILCDPRRTDAAAILNSQVKFREPFRPFAPAVPREVASDWFDFSGSSNFMEFVAPVRNEMKHRIPGVTHVDGTARLQTVERTDSLFHAVLCAFGEITGVPVLMNTSLNIRGEPIVCTPEQAFRCFANTAIEYLAIGRCLLKRSNQLLPPDRSYRQGFRSD